jgi:2-polyprenyl-3-methyl-5-hydroxy-6-metoxy-1,4-benzoquinol methylase
MAERIALTDNTFYAQHGNHVQRYEFSANYCTGKRVLDVGCGTGYGSFFLASLPGTSVVGVDISDEALSEATKFYSGPTVEFIKADVECLLENPAVRERGPFQSVVNFENIEHLRHPDRMLESVRGLLEAGGVFISSTPNGEISELDETGRYRTSEFHVKEYTETELRSMLGKIFKEIELFGQWRTPAFIFRKQWEKELFDQMCESYYNPIHQFYRGLKRLMHRRTAQPPVLYAGASYPWDYVIKPLSARPYPWPPTILIAVCRV